jgi:hypothetical protein
MRKQQDLLAEREGALPQLPARSPADDQTPSAA